MIFVDVVDGQERKQNVSYVNPTNARFVAELVFCLAASALMFSAKLYMDDRFDTERYKGKKGKGKDQDREKRPKDREERIQQFLRTYEWGRVLIVTGYSEQKRLLLETLAELPEAEVPPGLLYQTWKTPGGSQKDRGRSEGPTGDSYARRSQSIYEDDHHGVRDYIHEKKKAEVKDESIAGPSAQRVEKGKGPQQEAPIVKGPTPVAGLSTCTQRVEKNGGPQQKAPVAKGPAVKQSRAKAPSSSTVGPSKQHNQKQTKMKGEKAVADEDASVKIDKGKGKAVATEEDESDSDTDDEPVVGSDFKKPAKQLEPAPAPAPKTVSTIV
ncbi:hypothetical protein J3E68DRAFT_449489 [Trichoderma sp. SZMC 28012]